MRSITLAWIEQYLLLLAKTLLKIYQPVIIGITGSVGKTTTRETVYQVLNAGGLSVRQTEGNLNSDLGIALSILGYDHSPAIWEWPAALIIIHVNWLLSLFHVLPLPKYLVIEMGIDRLGDMKRLLSTIKPTIGIVTWIGEGHHLEFLRTPAKIAEEKGQLLAALPGNGLAIIPTKDPQVKILRNLARSRVVDFQETGLEAAPAIARIVSDYLHLDKELLEKAISNIKRPKGRLNELVGINGSVVIDDSYNASLPSVKLALDYLKNHPGKRKIAVIGDVLEQGQYEKAVHERISELANKYADVFVGVGKRLKRVRSNAWYADPDEAAAAVAKIIEPDDVILVKGSQGMRMEKISHALSSDKRLARQLLPRQSLRWQQIPFKNP